MKKLFNVVRGAKQIVFLDLEGTQFSHELIALGAYKATIKRDGTIKKLSHGFKIYVKPKKPIGRFVVNLTNITPQMLKNHGVTFDEAIIQFQKYIGKGISKTKYITFGAHDIRILKQSAHYTPEVDHEFLKTVYNRNVDIHRYISEYIKDGNNTLSLVNLCKLFSVELVEPAHDPLNDALMLAKLYDEVFKQTDLIVERYEEILLNYKNMPRPFVKVMARLQRQQTVTIEEFKKFVREDVE